MFAEIVFAHPLKQAFTYEVPRDIEETVDIGCRVLAPFGSRVLTGYVVALSDTTTVELTKIKKLEGQLDAKPIISNTEMPFYDWIAEYYLASRGEVYRLADPYGTSIESKKIITATPEHCAKQLENEKPGTLRYAILSVMASRETTTLQFLQKQVKRKNLYSTLAKLESEGFITLLSEMQQAKAHDKLLKHISLTGEKLSIEDYLTQIEKKAPKQAAILKVLIEADDAELPMQEVIVAAESNAGAVSALEKKGLIKTFEKKIERIYSNSITVSNSPITLTDEQLVAVNTVSPSIETKGFAPFLLYGVTGSGKTQIYIELIKKCIAQGKTAILLVPEISLTPQMTSRLVKNFGADVEVLHSAMSAGERYDAWMRIATGKTAVVTGPRSALFAPLTSVGLIIVDEEHDSSYKQTDKNPRYQARDAAVMKAALLKCPIVLGSATPSIETMYNAKIGKYKLLSLTKRVDGAEMPAMRLVDMRNERGKNSVETIFSKALIDAVRQRAEKNEGSILLQNRRGFANNVYCSECGEIEKCENCSVNLVHHISKNVLRCHYCGFSKPAPRVCSHCKSPHLKYYGSGTERVEDELGFYLNNVSIARIDSDIAEKKGQIGELFRKFENHEIDVLVGTQIVAKGLDFPHVTLVGVVSAETTLWMPDYRADERTFQLLLQVAGRAGRSDKPGLVLIQTENSAHPLLQLVLGGDYDEFYKREITKRQEHDYPPFTTLCLIECSHKDEGKSKSAITQLYNTLVSKKSPVIISAPQPAVLSKLRGEYRYQIMVRSSRIADPSGAILRKVVNDSIEEFNQNFEGSELTLIADVNPGSVL